MANSKRKCRCCGEYSREYIKVPLGVFCDYKCAADYGRKKADEKIAKEKQKAHREKLKQVRRNPRSEALKAAQKLARVSRADDNGNCTCVTCGHVGKWNDGFDGGHYIAKGGCSYWMLDPRNIWPQCKACNGNGMKFGNKEALYTLFMIDQFGREFVEHMHEMKSTVIKRTRQDYDDFITDSNAEISRHLKRF